MSHDMTKPTKWVCAQRRLRSAWAFGQSDQSLLCAQWVAKDLSFLHVDSKDSDQTGRMPRLIWVFAVRTVILLVVSRHATAQIISFTILFCAILQGSLQIDLSITISPKSGKLFRGSIIPGHNSKSFCSAVKEIVTHSPKIRSSTWWVFKVTIWHLNHKALAGRIEKKTHYKPIVKFSMNTTLWKATSFF